MASGSMENGGLFGWRHRWAVILAVMKNLLIALSFIP